MNRVGLENQTGMEQSKGEKMLCWSLKTFRRWVGRCDKKCREGKGLHDCIKKETFPFLSFFFFSLLLKLLDGMQSSVQELARFKVTLYIVCVCGVCPYVRIWVHSCQGRSTESKKDVQELILFFHYVGQVYIRTFEPPT